MKVNILASGSGGNCVALQSNETTILVDVGVAKTKIEKRLLEVGIRPDQITAIFITHAHGDHIKGLPLANKFKIPVYASEGEWKDITGVDEDLQIVLRDIPTTIIGSFEIDPFKVHHNAYEPLGYAIYDRISEKQCAICLDTGHVDHDMLHYMGDSDIYIIEANHEPAMLEASDYPISLKARILSNYAGHLSNEQTAEALSKLITGKGEQIFLTHLSHKNNLPTLAEMTVIRELKRKGFEAGKHYQIEVV